MACVMIPIYVLLILLAVFAIWRSESWTVGEVEKIGSVWTATFHRGAMTRRVAKGFDGRWCWLDTGEFCLVQHKAETAMQLSIMRSSMGLNTPGSR